MLLCIIRDQLQTHLSQAPLSALFIKHHFPLSNIIFVQPHKRFPEPFALPVLFSSSPHLFFEVLNPTEHGSNNFSFLLFPQAPGSWRWCPKEGFTRSSELQQVNLDVVLRANARGALFLLDFQPPLHALLPQSSWDGCRTAMNSFSTPARPGSPDYDTFAVKNLLEVQPRADFWRNFESTTKCRAH